ncbi:hypothetical protein Scep_004119 [Stephania cephalantha]|uniref:Uncharacterized protein n=1 Tax=Stephania cephalantha TaxID=152367 RepID=A0AAP0KUD5_9MAGN
MELPRGLLSSPPSASSLSITSRGRRSHAPYFRFPIIIESVRYGALMHELRTLGVRSDFVTNEACNRYREYWASADFKARSEKASQNRKKQKGRPWDQDDEVTPNDVFLHVHTKDHDGAELVRRCEEHTQATPNRPIDEKQLYYDAPGECSKGRVYGLGSLAKRKRRYEDPGASTSREPMVRRSELDAVVQRLA